MKPSHLVIIIIAVGLGVGVWSLVGQYQNLQGQVLTTTVQQENVVNEKECSKLSEMEANKCFQRLAIIKRDEDICENISKTSLVRECKRELEFYPY